ncbi:DUF6545 domain-containing protein [Streptomyces spectabilis]|uniref:DUF6545 domain-containing protein n=1 Tax=Streptomyces spectabilis TaxID=68270 RepID=UPI00340D386D
MWHTILTIINLTICAAMTAAGTAKAVAARRDPDLTLKLTASVLLHAALIFLINTPPVYRTVGDRLHSPNICGLLVYCLTLACVGHAHLMTQLWHAQRRSRPMLGRMVARWAPFYIGTIITLVILYAVSGAGGPSRPLHFTPSFAHLPAVVALQCVYTGAMLIAVSASVLQCRGLTLPQNPDLADAISRCLRWFVIALSLDLANLAGYLTATLRAATGHHDLDVLADGAWVATIASGLAATYGLVRLVLSSRRHERTDHKQLRTLWKTVVTPDLVLAPGLLWGGWDTRIALSRRITEIRDGTRRLAPWLDTAPARTVEKLALHHSKTTTSIGTDGRQLPFDLVAAQAAATLIDAARRRRTDTPPTNELNLTALPGIDVPAIEERAHLVRVAAHLDHPLVVQAQRHDERAAVSI